MAADICNGHSYPTNQSLAHESGPAATTDRQEQGRPCAAVRTADKPPSGQDELSQEAQVGTLGRTPGRPVSERAGGCLGRLDYQVLGMGERIFAEATDVALT